MYKANSYINRGKVFLNNQLRPGHKKLSTLMIYATDLCDSACKHCLIWAKRPVKFLPFDKIVEIMQSKCITPQTTVGLEGGEFMLHPDAEKILEWFTIHHPNFDLLSNCLKPEGLIAAVKKFPPKRLLISLDGTPETYLYMRGKPGYESVIKVIEALRGQLPISVMFTVSPYNDFSDLQHVAEVCKRYGIDMRVGIYNDIAFFDTVDKAHESDIGSHKGEAPLKFGDVKQLQQEGVFEKTKALKKLETEGDLSQPKHDMSKLYRNFTNEIPPIVKEFKENYDFLVLYNEWRQNNLKMRCYSILDSLVILPDGGVPICQNLDLRLGNVFELSLDEVFNGKPAQALQKEYVHNCNQCWLNFHRKYDVILHRTMEKFFGKWVTGKLFGYYQWEEDARMTYEGYFKKIEAEGAGAAGSAGDGAAPGMQSASAVGGTSGTGSTGDGAVPGAQSTDSSAGGFSQVGGGANEESVAGGSAAMGLQAGEPGRAASANSGHVPGEPGTGGNATQEGSSGMNTAPGQTPGMNAASGSSSHTSRV